MDTRDRQKKRIKVKFVNCPFVEQNCLPILQKYYDVEMTDAPEYAFFDYTNYKECIDFDCIRIVYVGENNRPDFNLFDYAIGYDNIVFDNRYLHMPLYAMPTNREHILVPALHKHEKNVESYLGKEKFCCFIVSNGQNSNPIREEMFHRISAYKHVDSAGRFLNNMPDGQNVFIDDTQDFIEKYKFQICFENSSYKGYTTEKLIGAFAAGVIPIYWGDPAVNEVFNEDSFIWLRNTSEEEIQRVCDEVKYLDQDDSAYLKMLQTPILKDKACAPDYFDEVCLESFLQNIFDQPSEKALKRTNAYDGWGRFYEEEIRRHRKMDESRFIQNVMRIKLKLRKLIE